MSPTRPDLRTWSTHSSCVPPFDSFSRSPFYPIFLHPCKKIGIGNRQLANKHFQTFISFLENFTNGTRTFFLTLMLEFSSTLMRWFSKTRPSFGTGSFSLDNKNLSSNKQISSFYTVHRPGHRPRWSTLQQRPGRWFSYIFHQLQKTLLPSRKPTSPIMACPDSVLMQGWLWWTWPGESQ